jgi:hypothetical protein
MRDTLVRKLICNGRMIGIGKDANTKSVNILIDPLKRPIERNTEML